jgi:DNA processing protein
MTNWDAWRRPVFPSSAWMIPPTRTAETDLRSTAGLYVRGNADAITQPGVAVVGTRHPTPYGLGMAERLACDLAVRGLVLFFGGLARGVDAAAHRGAINARGKTVAVFGTGVDIIYPKENTRLAERMLALGGALISEFPTNTFAAPQNFPVRNRINTAAPGSHRAAPWNRIAKCLPFPAMSPTKIHKDRTP